MSRRRGYIVERIRKRRCGHGKCARFARVALHIPVADIAPGDLPGVAAIPLCPEHLSWAVVSFTGLENRKNRTAPKAAA